MKVFKKFFILFFSIIFLSSPIFLNLNSKLIEISPEEREQLKQLGISDDDINQAMQLFENMTPEEEEKLNAAVKSLEEEMLKDGIDPFNPDPKKMDEFTKSLTHEPKPRIDRSEDEIEGPKTKEPKFKPIQPTATEQSKIKDISAAISSISNNIGLLVQKVSKDPELNYRLNRYVQEIKEFSYYLNIINQPNILKYLVKPEFASLYNSLIKLNSILSNQISLIDLDQLKSDAELDNPYSVLGVPYTASEQQIEEAYQSLKSQWDPIIIKQKQGNLSQKALKQKLKQARLVFREIQDAYDKLSDPQERNLVNLELKSEIQREQKTRRISENALSKIIQALSEAFYSNQVLNKIESLLKKYEPEALEIKKAKEAAEQKALVEQKKAKARKAPTVNFRPTREVDRYRPTIYPEPRPGYGYGSRYDSGAPYSPSPRTEDGAASAPMNKAGSSKKDGKKPGGKKEDKSKGKDKGGKTDGKETIQLPKDKKEQKQLSKKYNDPLTNLEDQLNGLDKSKIDIENNLEQFIKAPVKRSKKQIDHLENLEASLNTIDKNLSELTLNKGNIKDDEYLRGRLGVIKENYGNVLDQINTSLNKILNPDNLKKYKKTVKKLNLDSKFSQEKLIKLKEKAAEVTKKFNSLVSIIQKADKNIKAKDIKDISSALNKVELISKELSEIKYPFDQLSSYTRQYPGAPKELPQSDNLNTIKLSTKYLKDNLEYLSQEDNLELLNTNPILSPRWQLIQNQYSRPITKLTKSISKAIGKDKPGAISDEIKKRHFEENPEYFNLEELVKLSENIDKLGTKISKEVMPKKEEKESETKPSKDKEKQEDLEKPDESEDNNNQAVG